MNRAVAELLNRLESLGMLEPSLLAALRKQAAALPNLSPRQVMKALVDKGHLTAFQAKNVLAAVEAAGFSTAGEAPAGGSGPAARTSPPAAAKSPPAAPADDELAPLEDESLPPAAPAPAGRAGSDDELELLDDDSPPALAPSKPAAKPVAKPVAKPAAKPAAKGPQPPGTKKPATGAATARQESLDEVADLMPLDEDALVPVGEGLAPLEELGPDPLAATAASTGLGGGALLARPRKKSFWGDLFGGGARGARSRGSRWESPLMYLGGGGLLVLLLVGLLLYYSINTATSDEMWSAAEELYAAQSYTQAIEKYERFEVAFPTDANASKSRVRRHMAQLRMVVEGSKNWPQALGVAREILPQIEGEEKFGEAREELATLLPDIARGFVTLAREKTGAPDDQRQLIAQTVLAMDLVNNASYLPTGLRKTQESRIEEIVNEMASIQRDLDRDRELAQTVASMKAGIEGGDPLAAYALRKKLLATYPALESALTMREALAAAAASLKGKCQVVADPVPAAPPAERALQPVVFASRRGAAADFAQGGRVYANVNGAVYGLDAASGQVLWRYYLGPSSHLQPVRLDRQPQADPLLVNAAEFELLRLSGETGRPAWRFKAGGPLAEPLVFRNKILLASRTGELHEIDPESGASPRRAVLPQPLEAPPAFDNQRPVLYQMGEHSNLFALDAASLECREVLYLGHAAGSVLVQPAMMLGHLLIPENVGLEHCQLRVVAVNPEGQEMREAQPPLRLPGRILSPPVLLDRAVLFLTDRGSLHVVSVEPASEKEPVKVAAQIPATLKSPVIGYAWHTGGRLWVGDAKLTRYEVQTSLGKIPRKWIKHDGETFLAPPLAFGAGLFCLKRPGGSAGVTATLLRIEGSADAQADGTPLWETRLGVPAAANAWSAAGQLPLTAVNADGELFAVDQAVLEKRLAGEPLTGAASLGARVRDFSHPLAYGPANLSLVDRRDARYVFVADLKPMGTTAAVAMLKTGEGALAAPPTPLAGGFLAPLLAGRIELRDRTGLPSKALPFQPPVEAGSSVRWTRCVAVPENALEFLVADNRHQLFRVGVERAPAPALAERAKAAFDGEPLAETALAVVGNTAFLAVRRLEEHLLLPFTLPELKSGEALPLAGRVTWGPAQAGNMVVLALDGGRLAAFAGEKRLWQVDDVGSPAGMPAVLPDGSLLFATLEGRLVRLDGATGNTLRAVPLPELPGSGPTVVAGQAFVFSADGSLLRDAAVLAP